MLPVFSKFPPSGISYHCTVPLAALAVNVAGILGQTDVLPAVGAVGVGFMVTVTALRALMHPLASDVST